MTLKKPGRRYRVALVGCGAIAELGHLPSLLKHSRFELVATCDVRAERAKLLAQKAGGIEFITDHRALLDRPGVDAVVLALHPEHSVNVAIEFLKHGKPVLDEKPLATCMEDGRRLQRAVKKTGVVYQLGFVFRYCEMVRRVGEIVRRIGAPALFRAAIYDERLDRSNTTHFRMMQQIFRNSSSVTHEGSHVVDYFGLWNPSPVKRVSAVAMKTAGDFAGANFWCAQIQTLNGSTLEMEIGHMLPDYPRCTIAITGPGGSLELDFFAGTGNFRHRGRAEKLRIQPLKQDWRRQLDAFAKSMDHGRAFGATVEDGLHALAVTLACEQSAKTGKVIKLP